MYLQKSATATAAPRSPSRRPLSVLPVQRKPSAGACACGGSCPRCQKSSPQVKVSTPGDRYEREADRIADAITGSAGSAPAPSRIPQTRPQRRARTPGGASHAAADAAARGLGGGQPLDRPTRAHFESRLGHDLSNVRLHADARAAASAQAFEARAYTLGRDIVFGAGEYAPGTPSGRRLLAHELVHVVQQGAAAPSRKPVARASTPPQLQRSALTPGAYSVRLVTESGEQLIGPPELDITGAADGAAGMAPPDAAAPPEMPATPAEARPEEEIPVQRMPLSDSTVIIQRAATFTKPAPTARDPLARLASGLTPGLTTPMINGSKVASDQDVLTAISPSQVAQTGSSGGNVTCNFTNFTIDTGAEQIVASAPGAGGWTGKVAPAQLANPPQCAKVATVPVTMNALPSNADFVKRVQASEDEHVAEIRALHDRHFVPYDRFITGLSATGPNLPTCGQNLVNQLNNQHRQATFGFVFGYAAATKKLDGPGGTHNDTATVKAAADCSSATITLSQTNPLKPGASAGNVVPVAPTVTSFNPATLKASGNDLVDGKTTVKTFSNAADAKAALGVIQYYGMNSRNVIGPFEYFLVGKGAPSGALKGANELDIDPARYQVTLNMPNAGDWAITDVIGSAKNVNINVIVNFGAKRDEAYSAWAVMTGLGFTKQGWVGGTRQKPEMMYFRV